MSFGNTVTAAQDKYTTLWHLDQPSDAMLARGSEKDAAPDSTDVLILRQHLANFELWHEEDKARAPHATADQIARVKRAIDRLNQRRHDLTEQLDERLLELAHHAHWREDAALLSETPGMMADRLSIMGLKIFHTLEEMARTGSPAGHRERNAGRLQLLEAQRADLSRCLDRAWNDIEKGRASFRLYKQLKMYNDAELNPQMYRAKPDGDGGGV